MRKWDPLVFIISNTKNIDSQDTKQLKHTDTQTVKHTKHENTWRVVRVFT